jgi:hypothetical protein
LKRKQIAILILFVAMAGGIAFVSFMPGERVRSTLRIDKSVVFDRVVAYFHTHPWLIGLAIAGVGFFFLITAFLNWQWIYGENAGFFTGRFDGTYFGKPSPQQKRKLGFLIGASAFVIGVVKLLGLW